MAGCADQSENDFRIVPGAIVLIRTVISFSLNAELKSERPISRAGMVGTSRCDVPACAVAGGIARSAARFTPHLAPLNAARTAQRAVPTHFLL